EFAGANRDVSEESAPHPHLESLGGDPRIEPGACGIEEQAAVYFSHVYGPRLPASRDPQRLSRNKWDLQFAREAVSRSARHDRERGFRKHQRPGNLIHGPVT